MSQSVGGWVALSEYPASTSSKLSCLCLEYGGTCGVLKWMRHPVKLLPPAISVSSTSHNITKTITNSNNIFWYFTIGQDQIFPFILKELREVSIPFWWFVSQVLLWPSHGTRWAYLIFVMNAVNAVRVKILAECKKNSRRTIKILFWAILL